MLHRTPTRVLLVAATLAAAGLPASRAHAQLDVNPPLPNVLLLIDTSGSMERMADGKTVEETPGAACNPAGAAPTQMNRWATLVSVLTGSIQNFNCYAQSRSSADFKSEFTFDGAIPYDADYYLPFHRILSNGCTPGPGSVGPTAPDWYDWPANAIRYHPYNNTAGSCVGAGFQQAPDGILDVFRDRVRFGLMTFDTLPNAGTGAVSGTPSGASGMSGNWSYFLGWQGSGTPQKGQLPGCAEIDHEVGARNPAAPPWEGRLIPFGPYDATAGTIALTNDHVQEAIVAMRPYGATPLAGMLQDAYDFLINDASTNPSTGLPFGPANDPYYGGGCRPTYIILLSDGEPNLDLRDGCASINKCPYRQPHEIVADLASLVPTTKRVKTFAVGFGLSSEAGVDCKTLSATDLASPNGLCATATGALKACCTLGRIAYEGGTSQAYFADDLGTLKSALSTILSTVATGSTSRTFPVFASGASASGSSGAPATSYQFVSSFEAPVGEMWRGNLERKRYTCEPVNGVLTATLQNIDPSKGDDFAANLNTNDPARRFYVVKPANIVAPVDNEVADPDKEDVKETIHSRFSMRPNLSADDGFGLLGATVSSGSGSAMAGAMGTTPALLGMSPMPAICNQPVLGGPNTPQSCVETLMRWEFGEPNGSLPSREGNAFGSIYHSTPVVVGTPNEFLRDESYSSFASAQQERPLMLYTGTTDGLLHAFKVASNKPNDPGDSKVDSNKNNELWSFLPPYVLPGILSQYDHSQQFLLDGPAVVKDVVFERTQAQAQAGGSPSSWRTVLVGGGGRGGGYYYALDVTDPTTPVFLWQLSTDLYGKPLFGKQSGTPAIATVTLKNASDSTKLDEVAVAILPGGQGGAPLSACPATLDINRRTSGFSEIDSAYQPRNKVRCWRKGAARSLTIVRLDNGQVLMNFRGDQADGPLSPGLTNNVHYKYGIFDSPITGVPVAYPSGTGQVATRAYVGDADGTLWRIDLTSPEPADWSAKIAWDAYTLAGDTATNGQPIQMAPVVSVDTSGNTVIHFATGDQELLLGSSGMRTRVWSITEEATSLAATGLKFKANWRLDFLDGKRVTGPLSLFNSVLYFATYTPNVDAGCSDGYGSIWGVDFVKANNNNEPLARFVPNPATAPTTYVSEVCADGTSTPPCTGSLAGTIVFGVGVTQTPTCFNDTTVSDPYFGQATAVSDVNPGKFELVWQTGKGGAPDPQGAQTKTQTQTLPSPRQTTRIDSWAAVIE